MIWKPENYYKLQDKYEIMEKQLKDYVAEKMENEDFLKALEKSNGSQYLLGKISITREKHGREVIDKIILEKGKSVKK